VLDDIRSLNAARTPNPCARVSRGYQAGHLCVTKSLTWRSDTAPRDTLGKSRLDPESIWLIMEIS
jgi:hypothetical protein